MRRAFLNQAVEIEKDWWRQEIKGPKARALSDKPEPVKRGAAPVLVPAKTEKTVPMRREDLPELLTYKEAAKVLRCGLDFIYTLIRAKELEVQPRGRNRFIRVPDLMAYLEREKERLHA